MPLHVTHAMELKFTIDIRPNLWYLSACYLKQIPVCFSWRRRLSLNPSIVCRLLKSLASLFSIPSFVFNSLRTLFAKHRGWHTLLGISRFPRTTIPCRQFTLIPLSANLRALFYLLENEHLQKCIKTKDFNFL